MAVSLQTHPFPAFTRRDNAKTAMGQTAGIAHQIIQLLEEIEHFSRGYFVEI